MTTAVHAAAGLAREKYRPRTLENLRDRWGMGNLARSPMIAAAAMAASSLSVVTNANRLRRFTAPELPHDVVVSATDPVVEIGRDEEKEHDMNDQTTTVTDPVCGMTVDPAAATSVEHEGHTYYFCSKGCAKSFTKDPSAYLKESNPS